MYVRAGFDFQVCVTFKLSKLPKCCRLMACALSTAQHHLYCTLAAALASTMSFVAQSEFDDRGQGTALYVCYAVHTVCKVICCVVLTPTHPHLHTAMHLEPQQW